MQTISVREANQNFSKYLSLVEAGQEFVIAKRGKPVACLKIAMRPADTKDHQAHELALARQKWMSIVSSFSGSDIHGPFQRDEAYDVQP